MWFLVELSLEFLKFRPELQTHLYSLGEEAACLSFSVFIHFYCVTVNVVSHDLCRIQSQRERDHFDITFLMGQTDE